MSYLGVVLVIAGGICLVKGKKLAGLVLVSAGAMFLWGTVLTKS